MESFETSSQAASVTILFAKVILTLAIIFFLYSSYRGIIHTSDSTQVFISVAVLLVGLAINYLLEKTLKDQPAGTK